MTNYNLASNTISELTDEALSKPSTNPDLSIIQELPATANDDYIYHQHYLNMDVADLAELDEEDLTALAGAIAYDHYQILSTCSAEEKSIHVNRAHEFGITVPRRKNSNTDSLAERLCQKRWWRRKINKKADEQREHLAQINRELGRDKDQTCCTERTIKVMHERKLKTREFMNSCYKIISSTKNTENPVVFSIGEIDSQKKKSRISELFLDIKALEVIADMRGWEWVLITLTAPSKFHSNPAEGKNSYNPSLTPRMANEVITKDFESIRNSLKEQGCKPNESFFGVWVTEVHEDGCPHRHVLFFHEKSVFQKLEKTISRIYKDRPGDYYNRFKDDILRKGRTDKDSNPAAASTYIFKYLSFAFDADSGDELDLSIANRYRCAIKAMGARQFQMFGASNSRGKLKALKQVKGKLNAPVQITEMANLMFGDITEDEEQEAIRKKTQLAARVRFFLGESELLSFEKEKYINSYGEVSERILSIKHSNDCDSVQIGGLCEDISQAELDNLIDRKEKNNGESDDR